MNKEAYSPVDQSGMVGFSMDHNREGVERPDQVRPVEVKKPLVGEVTAIVKDWAEKFRLSENDLAQQLAEKRGLFSDKFHDGKKSPEASVEFWLKYGVKDPSNEEAVVLGKKGTSLYRRRIGISTEIAEMAADKMNNGTPFENLSLSERVAMLTQTKAKWLAVKDLMLGVYPALEDDWKEKNTAIDAELTKLLVDRRYLVDINGNMDLKRFVPAGKLAVPTLLTLTSLMLCACGGGVTGVGASSPEEMVTAEAAATLTIEAESTPTPTLEPTVIPTEIPTEEPTPIPTETPTPEPDSKVVLEVKDQLSVWGVEGVEDYTFEEVDGVLTVKDHKEREIYSSASGWEVRFLLAKIDDSYLMPVSGYLPINEYRNNAPGNLTGYMVPVFRRISKGLREEWGMADSDTFDGNYVMLRNLGNGKYAWGGIFSASTRRDKYLYFENFQGEIVLYRLNNKVGDAMAILELNNERNEENMSWRVEVEDESVGADSDTIGE